LLQIASLEYSSFLGRLAVGRILRGTWRTGISLSQSRPDGKPKTIRIQKVLRYEGIVPMPVEKAIPGDIVLLSGLDNFDIGDTLSPVDAPEALPRIHLDPPTISMLFTVNTSPLAG
jgi:GTP-binding protein